MGGAIALWAVSPTVNGAVSPEDRALTGLNGHTVGGQYLPLWAKGLWNLRWNSWHTLHAALNAGLPEVSLLALLCQLYPLALPQEQLWC